MFLFPNEFIKECFYFPMNSLRNVSVSAQGFKVCFVLRFYDPVAINTNKVMSSWSVYLHTVPGQA